MWLWSCFVAGGRMGLRGGLLRDRRDGSESHMHRFDICESLPARLFQSRRLHQQRVPGPTVLGHPGRKSAAGFDVRRTLGRRPPCRVFYTPGRYRFIDTHHVLGAGHPGGMPAHRGNPRGCPGLSAASPPESIGMREWKKRDPGGVAALNPPVHSIPLRPSRSFRLLSRFSWFYGSSWFRSSIAPFSNPATTGNQQPNHAYMDTAVSAFILSILSIRSIHINERVL